MVVVVVEVVVERKKVGGERVKGNDFGGWMDGGARADGAEGEYWSPSRQRVEREREREREKKREREVHRERERERERKSVCD